MVRTKADYMARCLAINYNFIYLTALVQLPRHPMFASQSQPVPANHGTAHHFCHAHKVEDHLLHQSHPIETEKIAQVAARGFGINRT